MENGEVVEQRRQGVGDGGHHFDENVQRDADNVFAGVADSVAIDDGFVDGAVLGRFFVGVAFK